jgi:hypothetical protein
MTTGYFSAAPQQHNSRYVTLRNWPLACLTGTASVLRIDYLSNTWNLHRAILCQYVTENVIDTGAVAVGQKPSSLDGCPMFAPAYMGRKRNFQMLSLHARQFLPLAEAPA